MPHPRLPVKKTEAEMGIIKNRHRPGSAEPLKAKITNLIYKAGSSP